jgi:hypothetical protein
MIETMSPGPLSLSLSKAARGARPKTNPHRVCFDKLSMSGTWK